PLSSSGMRGVPLTKLIATRRPGRMAASITCFFMLSNSICLQYERLVGAFVAGLNTGKTTQNTGDRAYPENTMHCRQHALLRSTLPMKEKFKNKVVLSSKLALEFLTVIENCYRSDRATILIALTGRPPKMQGRLCHQ